VVYHQEYCRSLHGAALAELFEGQRHHTERLTGRVSSQRLGSVPIRPVVAQVRRNSANAGGSPPVGHGGPCANPEAADCRHGAC
jgi:hypothetical protein